MLMNLRKMKILKAGQLILPIPPKKSWMPWCIFDLHRVRVAEMKIYSHNNYPIFLGNFSVTDFNCQKICRKNQCTDQAQELLSMRKVIL